jgi:hypothetical protein
LDKNVSLLFQHVMKFAELSQEVLVTKSSQQVHFDIGLTPGRRKLHQEYVEKIVMGDVIQAPTPQPINIAPSLSFNLGPPFPLLEVRFVNTAKPVK